ncbi:MAG TPA: hypothetical protein VIC06_14605 [Solirubrobacteraceae bacterium]|jgi:hypothetical protein
MPNSFFRNVETGLVKVVDTASEEFAQLKREVTTDGRFPLWEQTGAHDADPENHATAEEVAERAKHGIQPLSDVTADGVGQSAASAVTGSRIDAQAAEARAPERAPVDPAVQSAGTEQAQV